MKNMEEGRNKTEFCKSLKSETLLLYQAAKWPTTHSLLMSKITLSRHILFCFRWSEMVLVERYSNASACDYLFSDLATRPGDFASWLARIGKQFHAPVRTVDPLHLSENCFISA